MDEACATPDGPDGWDNRWATLSSSLDQQGGEGIVIYAGIIGGIMVGP